MTEGYAGIEREIIELILQRKYFYGHFLQQFKRFIVNKDSGSLSKVITTLAVNITDDLKPSLYVNTDFYNSGDYDPSNPNAQTWGMTQDEKIALLEHEILHILNKHLVRVENRNGYVWNLATDLAINQYIKGLPVGAVCPDCNIFVRPVSNKFPSRCPLCKKALDPDKHKCQGLDINNFNIGEKINFDPNNPSETYYDILWKKMPKRVIMAGSSITESREKGAKNSKNGNGEGEGDKKGEGQGQGDGKGDKGDDQTKGQGGEGERDGYGSGILDIDGMKVPIAIDNHEIWKTGTDNKEMAHEKIKDMVQKTMERADSQKSQGHLPSYVSALIQEVLAHKTISWKSELRKFVGYEEFACFESSRKRINRRFPIVQPGYIVKRRAHFAVAVDSSGSISDDEFGKFFKEISLMHAAKVSITYIECDCDIQLVEEYRKTRFKDQHRRVGYGGTDFRPVFEFLKKRSWKNGRGDEFKLKGNKKVDGIIYLTDGYGSFPRPQDIIAPTIWVMTPNHSDYGWNEKIGKKIVMKDD